MTFLYVLNFLFPTCIILIKRKQNISWREKIILLQFQFLPSFAAAAAAKSLQLCPTLCDPIDSSPPGSPVPGILQARTLEYVAISFSNEWKWKVKVKSLSCVRLLATPWTTAHQAPPSMGFSMQKYWRECHCLLRIQTAGIPQRKYDQRVAN